MGFSTNGGFGTGGSSGGSATWGEIDGTLSDQTDLQSALDGKASSSDIATAINNITDILSKPTPNEITSTLNNNSTPSTIDIIDSNSLSLTGQNLVSSINGIEASPLSLPIVGINGSANQINVSVENGVATVSATDIFNVDSLLLNGNAGTFWSLKSGGTFSNTLIQTTLTKNTAFTLPNANSNPIQPLATATSNQFLQYIDNQGVQYLANSINTNVLALDTNALTVTINGVASNSINIQALITSPTDNNIVTMNSLGQVINSGFKFNTTNPFDNPSASETTSNLNVYNFVTSVTNGSKGLQPVKLILTTNQTLSGFPTQGGYTCVEGDRVLCIAQTNTAQNLVYIVHTGAWTVASDSLTVSQLIGAWCPADKGSYVDNYVYLVSVTPPSGAVTPTAVEWSTPVNAGLYQNGTGLLLTGSVFSLANTTVISGDYNINGQALFTVNAQGQLTASSNVNLAISNLSDVTTTSPIINNVLTFNGTKWINSTRVNLSTNIAGGVLGSLLFQTGADTTGVVAPNTTVGLQFLTQLGNGTISASPSWKTLVFGDIGGQISGSQVPVLNQNTTGTASNITATSNSTLTTLSVLSLPYSQLSGTVPTWNQNTTGNSATATNMQGGLANQLSYQTAPSVTGFISSANSSVLITNSSGVPSWSTTLPAISGAGSLTEATSNILTISANNVLLSNANITVKQANASQSGYLSNTDWNTFKNKMALVTSPTANDFVYVNSSGQVIDSGLSLSTVSTTNLDTAILSAKATQTAISNALSGVITYISTWNANTNTPTLTAGSGIVGNAYIVSVGGTQTTPSGSAVAYNVGDFVVYGNGIWDRLESINLISSVFGRTGVITAQIGDYTIAQITNGLSNSLNAGSLFVGNSSNIATGVALSGDGTLSNAGVLSISANAITNTKLSTMATMTLKGNNTGGTGSPSDLSVLQVNTMLGINTNIQYVTPTGSDTNNGFTPNTGVATLLQALTNLGNVAGTIIIAPKVGGYTEPAVTVTAQNITIIGLTKNQAIQFTNPVTFAHTGSNVQVSDVSFTTLIHSGAGGLYIRGGSVTTSLSKSGNGYLETHGTDLQVSTTTVSITGTGAVTFTDSTVLGATTINNASAVVSIMKCLNSKAITLTAGVLGIDTTTVYSTSAGTNALTVASGSFLFATNSTFMVTGTTNQALVSVASGGFYSFINSPYSASSTILGTMFTRTANFDAIALATALPIISGGTGQTTATGITSILNNFVGDSGSGGLKGLVPAPTIGQGTAGNWYLNANGTWVQIGAGGTVTSLSIVPANGFTGTVATATSTPAITLSTSITGILYGNGTALNQATKAQVVSLLSATATPTASTIPQWDSNSNFSANNYTSPPQTIASSGGTTALTVASSNVVVITGTQSHTLTLPDATTISVKTEYFIDNQSTGIVTINRNGGTNLVQIQPNRTNLVRVTNIGTSTGSWLAQLPTTGTIALNTSFILGDLIFQFTLTGGRGIVVKSNNGPLTVQAEGDTFYGSGPTFYSSSNNNVAITTSVFTYTLAWTGSTNGNNTVNQRIYDITNNKFYNVKGMFTATTTSILEAYVSNY